MVWTTLLWVLTKLPTDSILPPTPIDAFALVSQGSSRGHTQGGQSSKARSKCDHCHCLGHTIDKCRTIHFLPPRMTNDVFGICGPKPNRSGKIPTKGSKRMVMAHGLLVYLLKQRPLWGTLSITKRHEYNNASMQSTRTYFRAWPTSTNKERLRLTVLATEPDARVMTNTTQHL